ASWASNTITISGTPTVSGVYDYSIPLTGGCGVINATGKITVTPIVTIAAFSPATSNRCQGVGAVTYTTTATNSTGLTYSLDNESLAGGNIINGASGVVTYAAAWSGTTTITASAAGCNGPVTTTHVVTVNIFAGTATNTTSATAICETATKTLTATPAGGSWTIVSGSGSITNDIYTPADVTADTDVTIKYTVASNGSCDATDADVTFTVNATPVAPSASISTQPTCETPVGSILLSGLPSGNWTINPGNITGSTITKTITDLTSGIAYSFTVTNDAGCTSTLSNSITLWDVICANPETTAEINGLTGGTTPALTLNDKLNGLDVVIGNGAGQVTLTGVIVPTGFTLNADATVTIAPNTPAGNYNLTYKICEVTNPTNCDDVISIIVVGKPTIDAVTETTAEINGLTGGTTPALTLNDKLNGLDVVIGNGAGQVTLTGVIVPTGFTLNADATVTIAPNTPAGNYDLTYSICEITNPTNCNETTSVIVVGKPSIIANPETTVSINGLTGGTTPALTLNDKLNNVDVIVGINAGNVKVTPVTVPAGLTLNADGTVTIAPNTPADNYDLTYSICEITNPTNCNETTSVIVVGKSVIKALTENTLPINGSTGGKTVSLIDNVTLNGNSAVIKNSNGGIILTVVKVPTGLTLNPDGTVTVKPGTPVGNYEIEYTICEYLNPDNCVTVKSYVPVISGSLQANNDNAGTIDTSKGQSSTTSIFDNDTLNGSAVKPADVILTTIVSNPNLILKADGTIEVKSGTPTGNYELTYRICEALNASNCSQAVAKISVVNNPPVTPLIQLIINNDGPVNVDGINGSLEFINVFDNDLLKGLPINPIDVILNAPQNAYFEFNQDGTVNVKPNTPGGNYTMTYQVCEKANPTNCASATLSVFVEAPAIAIIKTAVFNDENNNKVADAGETITYKFKVTNTGNVPLVGVTVLDPLPGVAVSGQAINLGVNESDEYNFTATYKITQSDINKGSVSNQASVQARSNKGVLVDDLSDDDNNTGDQPTVLDLTSCVIKVFNAFSPNGDEKNKRFYIQGLECYPDNTVEIYNRWGILVYDVDNYNNEDRAFVGYSQGRTTVKQSEGLPEGTYFYILKYKDSGSNSRQLSGYLYINK
ncbi:gliding motility-associated C-terminal domain-containing protein, partial [Flavobacterium aquidurense]|uniref:T9SS type B sorting domain-containing protein n=1 Tax=Flavobacterium aquidurense TaxID=362413 RepID=UPI003757C674